MINSCRQKEEREILRVWATARIKSCGRTGGAKTRFPGRECLPWSALWQLLPWGNSSQTFGLCPLGGSALSICLHGCLWAVGVGGCDLLWSCLVSTANFLLVQVQRPRDSLASWIIIRCCWPSWRFLSKYSKPPTHLLPVSSKHELPQPETVSRNTLSAWSRISYLELFRLCPSLPSQIDIGSPWDHLKLKGNAGWDGRQHLSSDLYGWACFHCLAANPREDGWEGLGATFFSPAKAGWACSHFLLLLQSG